MSLGRETGGGMSLLVQRQVGPGHVQHSAYDTPEESLDGAITLITLGVMSVHIIDPSGHVLPRTDLRIRFAAKGGGGIKSLGHLNWTGEPG